MSWIDYHWIETNEQLSVWCDNAKNQPLLALDTEFIRIRSLYAKLGLIQLFDGNSVALVDPTTISDFSPFIALLADQNVLKILHSCSEDLEIFQHYFHQLPTPMCDTQVMAAFVGQGISLGFAKLVQHYLGIELDKSASRTDWLARPLSETQRQYAAADVWYLLPAYQKLAAELAKTRWQQAVQEECEQLCRKATQTLAPEKAYKEISNSWQLNRQQLAVLQLLAKWRVEEAQKRDLALNFIVKEQSLLEIAKIQPKHTAKLLEFMHPNEVRIHGKKLLWLVEQGRAICEADYPEQLVRLVDESNYKSTLKALQTRLNEIQPDDLALELLASKRQLNQLFKWHRKGQSPEKLPELLKGWRKVFGEKLLSVL